jgi:uncharacterized membrane protein YfcA
MTEGVMTQAEGSVRVVAWPQRTRPVPQAVWLAALSVLGAAAYLALLAINGASALALGTVAAIGLAALASGIAGFAFSAISGAMLFQFRHDTVGVVETLLICSIAGQAMSVWLLRRQIRLASLAPFVAGGTVGVPLGVWLLLHLDVGMFKAVLGFLLVIYSGYMLLRRPITLPGTSRASDAVWGFIGGIVGGFAATPGAAVSIWCGTKGWDKARQRAVFQPFILLMQFVTLAAIAVMHPHGAPNFSVPPLAWLCVPVSLLGTWWGMALFKRLTDRQFSKTVNLLLIVSGAALVL